MSSRRIVAGLLDGTKQIAGELGTGEATVKEQRGHVMAKMQAGSVAQLVHFASRLGITRARGRGVAGGWPIALSPRQADRSIAGQSTVLPDAVASG